MLGAQGDRNGFLLDQGLHGPQVGERRVDGHVDRRHVIGLEAQAEVAHHVQRLEVVVVHLPVAADQRAAAGHYAGRVRRVAQRVERRAGRRDSMKQSDAPPPVEMKLDSIGQPEFLQGAGAVTAAHDGEAVAVGHGLGHHPRAGGEAGVLEDTHRAVPQHGPGLANHVGEGRRRVGPDVEPGPPVGEIVAR